MKSLLATKIGMTQVFSETGDVIPVTVVRVGRCVPVLRRTKDKNGYEAVLVAYGDRKPKHTNKPARGFYDKHKIKPARLLAEFRDESVNDDEIGKPLGAGVFTAGDRVDVIGKSKGRGFAGVVKRHGFSGAPASRGSHEVFRGGGSVGMHTYPGKVFKGKGMPGHMGAVTAHAKNLKVVEVDAENNVILLRGAVPGANGQIVKIVRSARV